MDLQQQLKETIDSIGRKFEEWKGEADKAYYAKGGTTLTTAVKDALAELKLDKLGQSIDDLTGKKEDLEKRMKLEVEHREALERKVNELKVSERGKVSETEMKALADFNLHRKANAQMRGIQAPAGDATIEELRAYKSAFSKYATRGERQLSADEEKALLVGSDPAGGYWVPSDTGGRIVTRVFELSPIRQIASVQAISTDRLEGINDLNEVSSGWVGEVQSRSDTATPEVGKYDIPVREIYAQPKASQKILDDAAIDIEAWLMGKVTNRFARQEGQAFVAGDGILRARGFTTYPTAATADATRAWGTFEHVATGVSGDFAASAPADILFDLEAAFRPGYLNNARIVTRRSVIQKIRKFKGATTGDYLWQPGLQAGKPNLLIGYPIVLAEDMPALAASSLSFAMGDFSEGYQVVDRIGIRTLRDPFTAKPYVVFYSTMRVGGGALNFEALKFIKFV